MAGMLSAGTTRVKPSSCDAFAAMLTTRAHSPGRVNVIGDHTDYNEGLALPVAIDLGTTVTYTPDGSKRAVFVSEVEPEPAEMDLPAPVDPEALRALRPPWARIVTALAGLTGLSVGGRGHVETNLPIGGGLASSAALEVATALAMGLKAEPLALALLCQRAEQAATGVPCGLMDQLVATTATEGNALLVDFADLSTRQVPVPQDAELVVLDSGIARALDTSQYRARREECEAASVGLGPLGQLHADDLVEIGDPVLRRRARHVISECERVRSCAEALEQGDLVEAGRLMTASHRSLAGDFDVSVRALDDLVDHLRHTRGVFGARMTGAGFGGCAVALAELGTVDLTAFRTWSWRVTPSGRARLL
jgi:galactokinase